MSAGSRSQTMVVCASHSPGMLRDTDRRLGQVFRAGVAEAARRVADFRPDLVVFFGSDHRRAFVDLVPAVAIMAQADALGDLGSMTGSYDVPRELPEKLAGRLLDRDFDITVVRKVALDHGFGQSYEYLLGAASSVPVIPIYINCATMPLGRPGRAYELGQAVGEELSNLGKRILFVGSGGLSHSPPSLMSAAAGLSDAERLAINQDGLEEARHKIDTAWDNAFLQRITEDPESLSNLASHEVARAGVGAHEVRTWLAAAAAAACKPMEILAYEAVTEWITGMAVMAG